jgi:hypothetical protein
MNGKLIFYFPTYKFIKNIFIRKNQKREKFSIMRRMEEATFSHVDAWTVNTHSTLHLIPGLPIPSCQFPSSFVLCYVNVNPHLIYCSIDFYQSVDKNNPTTHHFRRKRNYFLGRIHKKIMTALFIFFFQHFAPRLYTYISLLPLFPLHFFLVNKTSCEFSVKLPGTGVVLHFSLTC